VGNKDLHLGQDENNQTLGLALMRGTRDFWKCSKKTKHIYTYGIRVAMWCDVRWGSFETTLRGKEDTRMQVGSARVARAVRDGIEGRGKDEGGRRERRGIRRESVERDASARMN
jgi:hypothetical protein